MFQSGSSGSLKTNRLCRLGSYFRSQFAMPGRQRSGGDPHGDRRGDRRGGLETAKKWGKRLCASEPFFRLIRVCRATFSISRLLHSGGRYTGSAQLPPPIEARSPQFGLSSICTATFRCFSRQDLGVTRSWIGASGKSAKIAKPIHPDRLT